MSAGDIVAVNSGKPMLGKFAHKIDMVVFDD
jgi:hypothetical protein